MAKEYIEREVAKNAIYDYILDQTVSKYPSVELCKASKGGAEGAMHELDYVPAADVVEVVRCKDCVNYCGFERCKNGICDVDPVSKRAVQPYDFCSYGERKQG